MSLNDGEKLALYLSEPVDFTDSLRAIEETEKCFACNLCDQITKRLVILWTCDHVFCQDCIEDEDQCPVCFLPAWSEDHTRNSTFNCIAEQTELLKQLLQTYMTVPKDQAAAADSTTASVDNHEILKGLGKVRGTETGTNLSEDAPESAPEKARRAEPKFKITQAKPFPEAVDDSEETQIMNAVEDSDTDSRPAPAVPEVPKNLTTDSTKILLQDFAAKNYQFQFATPSPPKKRTFTRTPAAPAQAQKSPGQRTPKIQRLEKKNKKGETALHIAVMTGKIENVKSLIKEGADLNTKDNAGWTPLHEACNHGYLEITSVLLDAGALINVPGYDDETPLMDAARQGHPEILKLLLEKGADMTLRTSYGRTASDLTTSEKIKEILEEHELLTQATTSLDSRSFKNSVPEKIVISFSSKLKTEMVKKGTEILGATMNTEDATAATHHIIPSYADERSPRTLKYLQATARGIWIVTNEWLDECTSVGKWVCEDDFEILGSREDLLTGGPKRSRINMAAKCPAIFHGCHFYLHGFFKRPGLSKQQVAEILKLAGATMLKREPKPDSDSVQTCTRVPYHANRDRYSYTYYIIYDEANGKPPRVVRRGKVCTASLSWAFDCISQFYLCEVPQ